MTFFLGLYAVAFALLAFLPRWRWLLIGGLLALALAVWAWADLRTADGPGVILAIPVVVFASLGFLGGFAARALILATRGWRRHALRSMLILAGFFVGVPAIYIGWARSIEQRAAERRVPPSAACVERIYPARIGNIALALPLSPNIRFGEGYDFEPAKALLINEHARRFCARPDAPSITNLTIELERNHTRQLATRRSGFCARERSFSWWHRICRSEEYELPDGYPTQITLYLPGAYNVRRLHAFSADEAERILPRLAGKSWESLPGGFAKATDRYNVYFARPGRGDFLASCHRTRRANGAPLLSCRRGLVLSSGLAVIYGYRTPEARFAQTDADAEAHVREIVASLIARPPESPGRVAERKQPGALDAASTAPAP